ncbi:hypothetical protein N0V90_013469 [Kalmusia sp. IMI 367209]|nr:hypothetical protein N0V90_013469 [Kalmusia sp. IMI 367209]
MTSGWGVDVPRPPSDEPESPIENLPNELLQLVFSFLPTDTLKEAALVSRCFHRHATDYLWQSVNLMDKWTLHVNEQTINTFGDRGRGEPDEVLTHKCHLPTPNIFSELPHMYFNAENLSQDSRIHTLLWLAIRNLVNVHTLRIIYGHYNLTRVLLAAFMDPKRPQRVPLRKLWLESCCLSGFGTNYINFCSPEYATGLESVHLRRLRVESSDSPERSRMQQFEYKLSRGGISHAMHNAAGGFVYTTIELHTERTSPAWVLSNPEELRAKADGFDTAIWDELWEIQTFVDANQLPYPTPKCSPPNPMMTIIEKSWSTLTSLNLDWVLWRQQGSYEDAPAVRDLTQLSQLRFPHLRAFQLRNAVVPETGLPDGVYLFEDMFLGFMEAHTKIQCLAWPLDRFYGHTKPSSDVQYRSRGNVLIDLRLDSFYSGKGEMLTDEGTEPQERQERTRRRRFISEFASHMCKVEQLKLEGGIPRDEKRELVRALHYSPLKKLVLIGVTFPVGNTWGARGVDLKHLDPNYGSDATSQLEEEDFDGILASYKSDASLPSEFAYESYYGWHAEVPFLQTIALHHASSVKELKLCGYNASTALVVVAPPTTLPNYPPVDPAMMPQFSNRPPFRPQNFNRWAVALKTRFTPSALAYRVAEDIAPHLSEVAKARPGGIRVRASFCLGSRDEMRAANDIFDLDIRIGKTGQVLEFIGPREEVEKGRFWQKLEGRQWF